MINVNDELLGTRWTWYPKENENWVYKVEEVEDSGEVKLVPDEDSGAPDDDIRWANGAELDTGMWVSN